MLIIVILIMLVGANTVLCRYLNAYSDRYNGLSMSTLANYVTGLATAFAVLLIFGDSTAVLSVGALSFRKVMMFLGGFFGVALVELCIYITPRLPAFLGTVLIFVSQLAAGLAIDYILSGSISVGKMLGGALVLLGLAHYTWVGRRTAASCRCEPVK